MNNFGKDAVFILSPGLAQSYAISKIIHISTPGATLIGVICPGESSLLISKKYYRKLIFWHQIAKNIKEVYKDNLIIPTGAKSTKLLVENIGDLILGDVQFSKKNLSVFNKNFTLNKANKLGIPIPHSYSDPWDIKTFPNLLQTRKRSKSKAEGSHIQSRGSKVAL